MSLVRDVLVFALICLGSYLVGRTFKRYRLPTITGYLFTGALAGPFLLDILPTDSIRQLRFVDEISLAVIALVAGSELLFNQIKPRLKAIVSTGGSILLFGYLVLAMGIYLGAPYLAFTSSFGPGTRLALSLLGAAVLLALSPPSAIAVIKEVHARGRFTRTVLGVTVLMDVAIIVLFALVTSVASPLLQETSLEVGFVGVLALDLASASILGMTMGFVISQILKRSVTPMAKIAAVLALGFGVYELADFVRGWSVGSLGFEIYIEPLLISLIAGVFVANYTRERGQFEDLLHQVSPVVYVAFFTITGLSLKLDLLVSVLPFATGLFVIRAAGIALGTQVGSAIAGEPGRYRTNSWMAYITQAGIALGLAREVAVQFPTLGDAFATLIVSVVVINEIVGPLFLKASLRKVGEAHEPDHDPDPRSRKVIVFGSDGQALELARSLASHGRDVTVAFVDGEPAEAGNGSFEVISIDDLSDEALARLITDEIGAVVAMLEDDATNATILQFASEDRGITRLVGRVTRAWEKHHFDDSSVLVDPPTAIVALLTQGVVAPNAANMLLRHEQRELAQMRVTNPDLAGTAIKDLRLPAGVLLLEIKRGNDVVVVNGQTRLEVGDEVTLITDIDAEPEIEMVLQD